jgi:dolichol kinase
VLAELQLHLWRALALSLLLLLVWLPSQVLPALLPEVARQQLLHLPHLLLHELTCPAETAAEAAAMPGATTHAAAAAAAADL